MRRRGHRTRTERAQASVELALVLPVVVLLVLLAVQVGLLTRDRLLTVHAARIAARAVVVDPREAAASEALQAQGPPMDRMTVELGGDRDPGGIVTVTVRFRPTTLPLVGRIIGGRELTETLGGLVEGPAG